MTEPTTALPAARYSNILDGMNVANSGTLRSGTRQMSAAASSAGISALGTPGSSATLRSPSSATRRCRRCLSAPSPTKANRIGPPGRAATRAAASAIADSACEIPCVPAYSTRQSSGPCAEPRAQPSHAPRRTPAAGANRPRSTPFLIVCTFSGGTPRRIRSARNPSLTTTTWSAAA